MSKEEERDISGAGPEFDNWIDAKPGDKDHCFFNFLILVGIGAAGGLGLVMFAIRALA